MKGPSCAVCNHAASCLGCSAQPLRSNPPRHPPPVHAGPCALPPGRESEPRFGVPRSRHQGVQRCRGAGQPAVHQQAHCVHPAGGWAGWAARFSVPKLVGSGAHEQHEVRLECQQARVPAQLPLPPFGSLAQLVSFANALRQANLSSIPGEQVTSE